MLTRRTELLLDEERYSRVARQAAATNRSVGAVIREAIDRAIPSESLTRAEAARHFREAPRLDLGDADAVNREIDTLYDC